jgi:hypothetical protein
MYIHQLDKWPDFPVEMMLDATQRYTKALTDDRLFGLHAALFPKGRNGRLKIVVGAWRTNDTRDPMQVVSGPVGLPTRHWWARYNRPPRFYNHFHTQQCIL